jgi:hypothetical protein
MRASSDSDDGSPGLAGDDTCRTTAGRKRGSDAGIGQRHEDWNDSGSQLTPELIEMPGLGGLNTCIASLIGR